MLMMILISIYIDNIGSKQYRWKRKIVKVTFVPILLIWYLPAISISLTLFYIFMKSFLSICAITAVFVLLLLNKCGTAILILILSACNGFICVRCVAYSVSVCSLKCVCVIFRFHNILRYIKSNKISPFVYIQIKPITIRPPNMAQLEHNPIDNIAE